MNDGPGLAEEARHVPNSGRARDQHHARAVEIAQRHLLEDPIQSWVEVGPELVGQAMSGWLMRFEDPPFSLVDAVSFQVMRAEKVTAAFAFDHHFEVAGFKLLR